MIKLLLYVIKRLRSYYYFGNFKARVHGRIIVGNRFGIDIGRECSVNEGVYLQGFSGISIGDNVVLSAGCMILDAGLDIDQLRNTGKRIHVGKPVSIANNCWIGARAIILPGVKLGRGVVVGAASVVTRSFPDNVIVAGNPANVISRE
jgi:maltose O-acetyltransferase